jgi:tRNA threonylcarbamoyl adenosine modification protein (Sua5/YciO/YrdC/YwlC family)
VLVANARTLDGLAIDVAQCVRDLVAEFWPGALTVIVRAQPSLVWDLGEMRGTVALRMPDHPAALALLERTGPLAVSSANLTTRPAARDAVEAALQLGESVALYLDGGRTPGALPSTIVDATGPELRVVRAGAIDIARLREITPIPDDTDAADGASG